MSEYRFADMRKQEEYEFGSSRDLMPDPESLHRGQFTFYRSYLELLEPLPKKAQLPTLLAICRYALDGTEPELTGAPLSLFLSVRPNLDRSRKKASQNLMRNRSV